MATLFLTLKGKWYDMIASGEKREEYREIKPFWTKRLCVGGNAYDQFKDFLVVHFSRGGHFHPNLPQMKIDIEEISVGQGKPEWGAEPGKEYFVIKLGNIINKK